MSKFIMTKSWYPTLWWLYSYLHQDSNWVNIPRFIHLLYFCQANVTHLICKQGWNTWFELVLRLPCFTSRAPACMQVCTELWGLQLHVAATFKRLTGNLQQLEIKEETCARCLLSRRRWTLGVELTPPYCGASVLLAKHQHVAPEPNYKCGFW